MNLTLSKARSLTDWHMVTEENFDGVLNTIWKEDILVHDFELSGLDRHKEAIVSCQIGVPDIGEVFYFPLRHARGTNLAAPHQILEHLWESILDARVVGKNWAFDIQRAMAEGLSMPTKSWDEVEAAAVMFNVNEPWLELESLATQYVNPDAGKEEKAMKEKIMAEVPFAKASDYKKYLWYMRPEDVFEYGCADVRDSWALHEFYREKRTEREEVAYQDFTDFIRVLFKMEERGMLVDRQDLAERLTGCETAMSELETEFKGKVARGVNLASSQQVAKWFGLRHADDLHLSQIAGDRKPVADIVLKWRQFAKASGTYLEPLEKYLVKREKIGL